MLKLVMFDLDGTLVDTAPEIEDAVNDTLRSLALPEVPGPRVVNWIGHGTEELMVKAYAHASGVTPQEARSSGVVAAVMPTFSGFYARRCGTRSKLYPDVVAALKRLRSLGVHLALVTNKEAAFTRSVLAAHGLGEFFDPIVCGDLLEHKKPHPLPVRFCLERHAVQPDEALFVGDSRIDVAAARAAGVRCWAVPYGYNQGTPVADHQPERIIASIGAICRAIDAGQAFFPPRSIAQS